jgi:hypothetical protein
MRTHPITVYQYSDFVRTYRYLAGPSRAAAAPVDLSGNTVLLEMRIEPTDAAPIISVSTTPNAQGSISLLSGPLASYPYRIAVTIHRAALLTLPPGPWPPVGYAVLITDTSSLQRTFLTGPVTVIAGYAHD